MTRDWKAIAAAQAPDIPPDAIDRVRGSLEMLDNALRPLAARLPLEIEPSYVQMIVPDSEEVA